MMSVDYGRLDLAEKHGIVKKVGSRSEINGTTAYAKTIYAEPEKYFTDELMQYLDAAARMEFTYGGEGSTDDTEEPAKS